MRWMKMSLIMFMLMVFAMAATPAFAAGNIAYVDLSRVFDEYHKTVENDKELEKQHAAFEKERNAKIDVIRQEESKLGLLTEDNRKEMEQNIEKMKTELLEFDRQMQTDLTKQRNEIIRELLLEIETVVSDFAKKEGYSLILNDRVLIYGDETVNVTEPILQILNGEKAKQ